MELNGVLAVLALLSNKGLGPMTDPNIKNEKSLTFSLKKKRVKI
ncbi:hypothetical protein D068_cds29600 [Bacillus atrophaeus UCMB-5137]|nr:hypothetical protein D068_cds29600 [Bacillus atrophaeus UCMB-5137]